MKRNVKEVPSQDSTLHSIQRTLLGPHTTDTPPPHTHTHAWAPGLLLARQELVSELVLLLEEPVFLLSPPALTHHTQGHACGLCSGEMPAHVCTQTHISHSLLPCFCPGSDPSRQTCTTFLTSGAPLLLGRTHSVQKLLPPPLIIILQTNQDERMQSKLYSLHNSVVWAGLLERKDCQLSLKESWDSENDERFPLGF